MELPEDPQFEHYLKQFRPRDAAPLPRAKPRRSRARVAFLGSLAALAAAVVLAALFLHRGAPHIEPPRETTVASVPQQPAAPPLTLGSANAMLAESTSVKATLNRMAFRPPPPPLMPGQRSALAVLSEGKDHL